MGKLQVDRKKIRQNFLKSRKNLGQNVRRVKAKANPRKGRKAKAKAVRRQNEKIQRRKFQNVVLPFVDIKKETIFVF